MSQLTYLTSLDLSHNYLNGVLSDLCGNLIYLQILKLDSNNLTSLAPGTPVAGGEATLSSVLEQPTMMNTGLGNLRHLRWFSANNNSITCTFSCTRHKEKLIECV